jgi:hypothetical protein
VVGVRYEFLGLRRMSTRWGSCVPARGRIWLNLALLDHAPDLLEYVVVHEVVHLRESSHGPRFHALMSQYLPDWPERRLRLDSGVTPVLELSSVRSTVTDLGGQILRTGESDVLTRGASGRYG